MTYVAGTILKQFGLYDKKPDARLDVLIAVGYGLEGKAFVGVNKTNLFHSWDEATGADVYHVEVDREMVFKAAIRERLITFHVYTRGAWEVDLQTLYALLRDERVVKLNAGAGA